MNQLIIEEIKEVSTSRSILAFFARAISPGYGSCLRCRMPWKFAKAHMTLYGKHPVCFPLCQQCWQVLTPEERLPFYRTLFFLWHNGNKPDEEYKWKKIERAVSLGL